MALSPGLQIYSELKNGDGFKTGDVVCRLDGLARGLLAIERPFLNLASYASGIATHTRAFVQAVSKVSHPPRIVPTRKTLPHYRDLAVLSVLSGGGASHRVSLSGGVLIKENHIASAGGISRAVQNTRAVSPHLLKIEIEVRNESELREALQAGADGVLLDNFTPEQARSAVASIAKLNPRPFIEISGGVTVENISTYAIEGVDVISIGSLTLSVRATDLSLLVDA
jgi:nicotinate-nucleotide pyrophosphorylase (carboxylating)